MQEKICHSLPGVDYPRTLIEFEEWFSSEACLQYLRLWFHAMIRPGSEKLSGFVEVYETYVGGLEEGVHGRHAEKKAIVVIAVDIHVPMGFSRVPDVSAESLVPFVRGAVEPGSVVHTNGWSGAN